MGKQYPYPLHLTQYVLVLPVATRVAPQYSYPTLMVVMVMVVMALVMVVMALMVVRFCW